MKKGELKIEESETFSLTSEILKSEEYKKAYDIIGKMHLNKVLELVDKDSVSFINFLDEAFLEEQV